MTGNKKFDYDKAIEDEKLKNEDNNKTFQDYLMKGLQILLGIAMAIFHV